MMNKTNPNFIVHYSRGEPFRSITSFPQDQWQNIIENLNSTNAWGLNRFADPLYLKQRVRAEAEIHKAFIAKGGKPQIKQPIYFFLGTNARFEKQKLNKAYKINLDDLESEQISFTYGDSMLAFIKENRDQSGSQYQNPLCGEVFRLEELGRVYSSVHFPDENQLAIEAQLWTMPRQEIIETLFNSI
jgi:hypothetical protein